MKSVYKCIFLILCLLLYSCKNDNASAKQRESVADAESVELFDRLSGKAGEAYQYCVSEDINTDFCVLVDMMIPSGKYRFFVWDFNTQSIAHQYLVTHGTCDGSSVSPEMRKGVNFSNLSNSHCSSLGKYKIGKRDYSSWGINVKYWLHGQESTNNKAADRVVVLHSWEVIPDEEVHPIKIARSWGCPAVSNQAMRELDDLLKNKAKSTLLWIFN